MEIRYEVSEEDYIKFNIHHAENSKTHKRTYNMLKYVLPTLCAVYGMILIYLSGFTAHIVPTRYLSRETKEELLEKLGISKT